MCLSYEALLLAALLFVANFVLLPIVSPIQRGTAHALAMPDLPTRVLLFCVLFAIMAAYFIFSWTGGRRTLPMQTWQLRIVGTNGESLGYKRAFARYLCAWIGPALALTIYALLRSKGLGGVALILLPLNYYAALFDPDRQFLHDRIAGTRIVQKRAS